MNIFCISFSVLLHKYTNKIIKSLVGAAFSPIMAFSPSNLHIFLRIFHAVDKQEVAMMAKL